MASQLKTSVIRSARAAAVLATLSVTTMMTAGSAQALDLDWSGQFRSEANYIHNYNFGNGPTNENTGPTARANAGGYYIPGGGSKDANFQSLFMRLRPKVIVNDNVYIKSEFWAGDPVFGLFGDAVPYSVDRRQWYSSNSRGATFSAQRLWAEFITDVGTVQVGRAPLHWGLGIVWNSGDDLWDRYQSTGDVVRLVSKFGSFSFTPSIVKYSMGNTVGGGCNYTGGICSSLEGNSTVADYTLMLKFENPDEDFEGGVNFIKRLGGSAQDSFLRYGYVTTPATSTTQVVSGMNYNTWDIYGKKSFGKFSLGAEVPIVTGDLGGTEYATFAGAVEGNWKPNDTWDANLKLGHAPGQPNITSTVPDKFQAYYFHPSYKLGLIMFNYQFANFAGVQTLNNPGTGTTSNSTASGLSSPYDNPIVNANYLSAGGGARVDKWHFHARYTYARALESAAPGANFYNPFRRAFFTNTTGTEQSKSLGWEMDYGTSFFWDENFSLHLDFGWFFPGAYWKFSNTSTENATDPVFATSVKVGVNF